MRMPIVFRPCARTGPSGCALTYRTVDEAVDAIRQGLPHD
jgi:hypothetical protein